MVPILNMVTEAFSSKNKVVGKILLFNDVQLNSQRSLKMIAAIPVLSFQTNKSVLTERAKLLLKKSMKSVADFIDFCQIVAHCSRNKHIPVKTEK